MIAGDSWAWLTCLNNSLHKAFAAQRVPAVVAACVPTTGPGIRAENWFAKKQSKNAVKMLKSRPDIEAVYLSLGGNDILNRWHKSMSPAEEDQVITAVRERILQVVRSFHAVRPDVKVLVSGYDYARFVSEAHRIKSYQKLYEKAGSPTTVQMHSMILKFVRAMAEIANGQNVFYIHHHGVLHYHWGQSEAGIPPGFSKSPDFISPPENPAEFGGFPELELDTKAMIRVQKFVDSYHVTPQSYFYLAEHSTRHYFRRWFGVGRSASGF